MQSQNKNTYFETPLPPSTGPTSVGWQQNEFLRDNSRRFNCHPYHLVDPSPWPVSVAVALFVLTTGIVMYFHGIYAGKSTMLFGGFFVSLVLTLWWRDVIREATYKGLHTLKVAQGIRIGVVLFIISEVMFFFSFFWAFLHSSLAPAIEIGGVWPPKGLTLLNPFGIPLLNTLILLTSGATVTLAHAWLRQENFDDVIYAPYMAVTVLLAAVFTGLQINEYMTAPFNISDGIYGSTFFLSTGFHGLHVVIGSIFLIVCWYRGMYYHFTARHHIGFEAAAWYWHFVDVVWLFLFLLVYVWGSL
jgi:cytochrome c oxidase subunit 3